MTIHSSSSYSVQFSPILFDIKKNSGVNYIQIVKDPSLSLLIDAPSEDTANNARKLLELNFKLHKKLMNAEQLKNNTLNKLYEAQGDAVAGESMQRL